MKKKTHEGRVIRTLKQLNIVMGRHQWVYFAGRAYHPGWVMSWRYGMVVLYVKSGRLREALSLNDGSPYVSESEEIVW